MTLYDWYSSDNGASPNFGGDNYPFRGGKSTMWDGALRVVSFVHGAMLKQKGVASNEFLHISDWFPTLVNLAGGNVSDIPVFGYDIWNTIRYLLEIIQMKKQN